MDLFKDIWPYVAALIPTLGLLFLFYLIMKNMLEGDRKERAAIRAWDQQKAGRENSQDSA